MRLAIIDAGASTSELGSPGQTSVVPPNQWSLRGTETLPDDPGAQQRDSVPGSRIVYGLLTESLVGVDHVYRTGCHVTFRIHSTLAIAKFDTLFSYIMYS